MATQKNHVLGFTPLTADEKSTALVTVKWSQSFTDRSEQYYAITATNKNSERAIWTNDAFGLKLFSASADVALFIQKSLYDLSEKGTADGSGKTSGPKPVGAISRIQDGLSMLSRSPADSGWWMTGKVELTINDKFQYGQQNAAGEKRFVVYHDTEHKPYQASSILCGG
jgi:hypothetical protein